jgi:hypothetical protein
MTCGGVVDPEAIEVVVGPPDAHVATNTSASPLTYSALLTSANFILDDNVALYTHGNPTLLPADWEGDGDATGTLKPEAAAINVGRGEAGEEEEEEEEGDDDYITDKKRSIPRWVAPEYMAATIACVAAATVKSCITRVAHAKRARRLV